jgi:hypothetical protein
MQPLLEKSTPTRQGWEVRCDAISTKLLSLVCRIAPKDRNVRVLVTVARSGKAMALAC